MFPPTVVAYKKGALDGPTVQALRTGLLTAHESSKGARLMNLIKIDRFDAVPAGYEDTLKACRKAYPAPVVDK